jgi:hypothetical protein
MCLEYFVPACSPYADLPSSSQGLNATELHVREEINLAGAAPEAPEPAGPAM